MAIDQMRCFLWTKPTTFMCMPLSFSLWVQAVNIKPLIKRFTELPSAMLCILKIINILEFVTVKYMRVFFCIPVRFIYGSSTTIML